MLRILQDGGTCHLFMRLWEFVLYLALATAIIDPVEFLCFHVYNLVQAFLTLDMWLQAHHIQIF